MKCILIITGCFILLGIANDVCPATYTIPLSVTGKYNSGDMVTFSFDIGEELLAVHDVRFKCSGTVVAGLSYWSTPFSWNFQAWMSASPGYWYADGPAAGETTYPDPESFDGESSFKPLLSPTWDFLLDGKADGWVEMPGVMHIPEYPPIELPTGVLEEASLIIEATALHEIPLLETAAMMTLMSVLALAAGLYLPVPRRNY